MKIKNKIALTLAPLMVFTVLLINIVFGIFFQKTIDMQEQSHIEAAKVTIASFIDDQSENYLGTAADWAHWDDTYNFIALRDSAYITDNMTETTFINLNLSFITMIDNGGDAFYKQYYSIDDERFMDFPRGFDSNFNKVIEYAEASKNTFGIYKLGNNFYFVASTYVTDSTEMSKSNGRMIIGRQIDESIVQKMLAISGTRVVLFDVIDDSQNQRTDEETVIFKNSSVSKSGDVRYVELVYPNSSDPGSSIKMTFTISRALYLSEIQEMRVFAVLNTVVCFLGAVGIILVLSRYLSKPVGLLIKDIKAVDITRNKILHLKETGKDEFSFIRKTINMLLSKIDIDQKALYDSREELYATLISVGDGVIVADKDEKIKFMNPVALDLTGWTIEEAKGQKIDVVFNIINEYTRAPVESPVKDVFRTDSIIALSNHTVLISKDGKERAIEDTAAPIKDAAGRTDGCVLVFKDTSEKKEKNRQIEYLSYHDQLTGLYNRRFFENELKRLDMSANLPLSIIYADVNGLKIINDAFGHESGDKIIQQVSKIFSSVCRPDDIVARVGGDEFVTLLPKTGEADIEKIIDTLREKTSQLTYMDIDLSIAFGWDTKYDESQQALDVLRNAEDIMYQKKMLSSTSMRNGVIKSILNTLQLKCPREEAHSVRVSSICESIGYAYNLSADEIKELTVAGELHDIGKITIDESILNKTGELTKAEWTQIKHHPEIGFRLLGATNEFNNIAEYVLAHHEKWDGSGYPKGLKGAQISWKARVITIADSYDAMTCDRPYRKALDPQAAAEEIKRCAGTQFDPDIARVFIEKVLKLEW